MGFRNYLLFSISYIKTKCQQNINIHKCVCFTYTTRNEVENFIKLFKNKYNSK